MTRTNGGAAGEPASWRYRHESRCCRLGPNVHEPGDSQHQGGRGGDCYQSAERDREQHAGCGPHGCDGMPAGGIRSGACGQISRLEAGAQTATSCTNSRRCTRSSSAQPAKLIAMHAGLECGVIGDKYPGMQMVSFGPTIVDPHSPNERVQISSVESFWNYLKSVLERCKPL